MKTFVRALRALENSWLGDLFGAISIFVGLYIGLLAAAVLQ